jgi:hypothetical protein
MAGVGSVKVAGQSIMPNDYAKRLSKTEIDNLLAYLARQTSRRAN